MDVAIGPQKYIITFANDQKGVDTLAKKLSRIGPELTVFESTGGYELLATSSLAEAGLPVLSSTRGKYASLLKRLVFWPRQMPSTHGSSPTLQKR